jgi:hypothetical protein
LHGKWIKATIFVIHPFGIEESFELFFIVVTYIVRCAYIIIACIAVLKTVVVGT